MTVISMYITRCDETFCGWESGYSETEYDAEIELEEHMEEMHEEEDEEG